MPLHREYHGHQIVSSDDMRRHEVFTEGDHPKLLGVYPTLGLAIAKTRGWPDVAEPIQPEEPEEPLSAESIAEAVAMDSDGVVKPTDELSEEN